MILLGWFHELLEGDRVTGVLSPRLDYASIYETLLSLEGERLSWDEQAMLTAVVAAGRASCPRAKNGAVLVIDRRVVATGWNSPPRGLPNCNHPVNNPCRQAVHAEEAAIVWAARNGIAVEGAVCYVTSSPCTFCARMLVQAGISEVCFLKHYRDRSGLELLGTAGIEVRQMELWRPAVGFDGYEVSSTGRVRSYWTNVPGRMREEPKLLSPYRMGSSTVKYWAVDFSPYKVKKQISHLVLEAFVGPRPEGMVACHNDGDANNNSLGNLRWATPLENEQDKKLHGTGNPTGEEHPWSRLSDAEVAKMRDLYWHKDYSTNWLAAYFAVSRASVGRIVSGKQRNDGTYPVRSLRSS